MAMKYIAQLRRLPVHCNSARIDRELLMLIAGRDGADNSKGNTAPCFVSYDTLAGELGRSRWTVIRRIRAFKKAGWVTVKRRPNDTALLTIDIDRIRASWPGPEVASGSGKNPEVAFSGSGKNGGSEVAHKECHLRVRESYSSLASLARDARANGPDGPEEKREEGMHRDEAVEFMFEYRIWNAYYGADAPATGYNEALHEFCKLKPAGREQLAQAIPWLIDAMERQHLDFKKNLARFIASHDWRRQKPSAELAKHEAEIAAKDAAYGLREDGLMLMEELADIEIDPVRKIEAEAELAALKARMPAAEVAKLDREWAALTALPLAS